MFEELALLAAGDVFGLAGGFTPGPTSVLVVSQTVPFGSLDGLKIIIAPLLTDAPIIILSAPLF